MANLNAIRKYLGFKVAQDSAPWEESKHHRADDGKFTSGSGRGKTKEEEPKDGGDKNVKREEMSEEKATKIVREAFKVAKKELKGLKLVDHSLEADTDVADEDACKAINEFLTKKGLKAKVSGEAKFKIAEDGYDDIQVMDDQMLEVLIDLCKIEMAAKDLHYRAKGKPFYGIHELADLVKEIADSSDELNEVYYMGEKQMDPPERAFVAAKAAQLVGRGGDENALIKILVQFCDETVQAVENAKKQGVASGTAAVLDEISKKALQAKGLLERTAKEMPEQKPVDPNAIDKVIGKGLAIENGAEPAQDAGTSEGAKKGWLIRERGGRRYTWEPNGKIRPNDNIPVFGENNATIYPTREAAEKRMKELHPDIHPITGKPFSKPTHEVVKYGSEQKMVFNPLTMKMEPEEEL